LQLNWSRSSKEVRQVGDSVVSRLLKGVVYQIISSDLGLAVEGARGVEDFRNQRLDQGFLNLTVVDVS